MKVVAAYLLAGLGGNAAPSEADIKKILSSGAWGLRGASGSMREAAGGSMQRRWAGAQGSREGRTGSQRGGVATGRSMQRGAGLLTAALSPPLPPCSRHRG